MSGVNGWHLLTILGLAAITVLARTFFLLPTKPWRLPRWAERGLHFAPIAALSAVVLPEIVMQNGHLIHTLKDARLYGALAGAAYFFWRRGMLGCIVSGMAVYLPLRLALGW